MQESRVGQTAKMSKTRQFNCRGGANDVGEA
jgi:hypothetical protein